MTNLTGSTKMISMEEALARERMSEWRRSARVERVSSEMAAARRWHRLERIARSAHQRHARAAREAAAATSWE
jgi:hypothetical protein